MDRPEPGGLKGGRNKKGRCSWDSGPRGCCNFNPQPDSGPGWKTVLKYWSSERAEPTLSVSCPAALLPPSCHGTIGWNLVSVVFFSSFLPPSLPFFTDFFAMIFAPFFKVLHSGPTALQQGRPCWSAARNLKQGLLKASPKTDQKPNLL